ncbi:MAG: hypothetical protein JWM87_3430 [Candidatus Eremiobacteraeota bacterium]|nr:hypothetical protein [Candidatus Eremiobacteraeota bacterium]
MPPRWYGSALRLERRHERAACCAAWDRPRRENMPVNAMPAEFSYTSDLCARNGMPQRWIDVSQLATVRPGAEVVFELPAGERARLSALLGELDDPYDELRFAELVAQSHALLERTGAFDPVRAIRSPLNAGFYLLRNLPVCDPASRGATNERLLLMAAAALGSPFGFEAWHRSEIVHSIEPKQGAADQQLGDGNVELLWHVEDAHTALAPDYFALLCVRADPAVRTFVRKIDVRELDASTLQRLSEESFLIGADESFRERSAERAAVLSYRPDGGLAVRYDPLYTTCASPEHAAALDVLTSCLADGATGIVLEAGDMLVVDNRAAVHSRSSYTPRFDGRDRLLRKVFIRTEPLAAHDAASSSPFLVAAPAAEGIPSC